MRFRIRVPLSLTVLALIVGTVTFGTAAVASAAPHQRATRFDTAISASFAAAQRALVTETGCGGGGSGTCEAIINLTSGPLSGGQMGGADSYYRNYPLPDEADCSGFIGWDCWEVESQTWEWPGTKSGYLAYVSTENDGEEKCTSPNTGGWQFDMEAYNSVSYSQYFNVTADWTKGQYRGGDAYPPNPRDECNSGHGGGLNMSHWINVNNYWYWWNTGVEEIW